MQKIIAEPGKNAFRYINDTVGAALIHSLILFSMRLLFLFTRIKGRTLLKYKSIFIYFLRNKHFLGHCINNNIKEINTKYFVTWFYSKVLSNPQIQNILALICHYLASISLYYFFSLLYMLSKPLIFFKYKFQFQILNVKSRSLFIMQYTSVDILEWGQPAGHLLKPRSFILVTPTAVSPTIHDNYIC